VTRAKARRRAESVTGHLIGIAVVSALTWWGLEFTALPELAAAWCSGMVAGLCCLPAIATARRTLAAATAPARTSKPRPRRATGGER
jgi:hypothetical protein